MPLQAWNLNVVKNIAQYPIGIIKGKYYKIISHSLTIFKQCALLLFLTATILTFYNLVDYNESLDVQLGIKPMTGIPYDLIMLKRER